MKFINTLLLFSTFSTLYCQESDLEGIGSEPVPKAEDVVQLPPSSAPNSGTASSPKPISDKPKGAIGNEKLFLDGVAEIPFKNTGDDFINKADSALSKFSTLDLMVAAGKCYHNCKVSRFRADRRFCTQKCLNRSKRYLSVIKDAVIKKTVDRIEKLNSAKKAKDTKRAIETGGKARDMEIAYQLKELGIDPLPTTPDAGAPEPEPEQIKADKATAASSNPELLKSEEKNPEEATPANNNPKNTP